LEVECLDRLDLNGYIGKLATGSGLWMFMRFQLGMPVGSVAKTRGELPPKQIQRGFISFSGRGSH
jgi:hypothetical protein